MTDSVKNVIRMAFIKKSKSLIHGSFILGLMGKTHDGGDKF